MMKEGTLVDNMDLFPELAVPVSETAARDLALDELEARRRVWVEAIRAAMVDLYRMRKTALPNPFITGADAREYCDDVLQVPESVNRNFLGTVFRHRLFEPTGQTIRSPTPGRKGSRIMCWKVVGE